jgi:hypothetical protein
MRVRFAIIFFPSSVEITFLAFSNHFLLTLKELLYLIALVSDQPPLIKSILLFGFFIIVNFRKLSILSWTILNF